MSRLFLVFALTALPALGADPAWGAPVKEFMQHRQYADAQALLEQATAGDAQDAAAWKALGEIFLLRNEADKAVATLEKAAALPPPNSETQRLLGDAYGLSALKAGVFGKLSFARKCKAAYDKAVEIDPRNLDARWSVMEYCRQAPGFVGGGMEAAYAQAEEIRKLDADRGRIALATLYTSDKKFPEAFALFDEALRTNPDDYTALYQTGRLAAMTGERLDQGLVNLRKCLTLSAPTGQPGPAPVNWRIGGILERKGDRDGARAAYEAAISADPKFIQAAESLRKLQVVSSAKATPP